MKITIEQLKDANACWDGIDWFRENFGEAYEISEWTPAQQAGILMDPAGRKFFGWAVRQKLIPAWSMAGADLRGADLHMADLIGSDLHGADLRGANLSGSNLIGSDLRGADLRGANLSGANLFEANLRGSIGY